MARKKKIVGHCHLCGIKGPLSFEHVPPRSAFNDHPVFVADIKDLIGKWDGDFKNMKGKIHQLGAGGYTLCEKCNNLTGAWYGRDFADWAFQAYLVLHYTKGEPSLFYQFRIFPLRVIKQIVCMFFSANGARFREKNPDLERFVLNREARYIRPEIRIYVYYNLSGISRQSGVAGLLNLGKGKHHTFSEIAFLPLGYVMTFESEVPDDRPVDITFFANYRYDDWKEFSCRIPVLNVYTYFPGDYRSRKEVLDSRENST